MSDEHPSLEPPRKDQWLASFRNLDVPVPPGSVPKLPVPCPRCGLHMHLEAHLDRVALVLDEDVDEVRPE